MWLSRTAFAVWCAVFHLWRNVALCFTCLQARKMLHAGHRALKKVCLTGLRCQLADCCLRLVGLWALPQTRSMKTACDQRSVDPVCGLPPRICRWGPVKQFLDRRYLPRGEDIASLAQAAGRTCAGHRAVFVHAIVETGSGCSLGALRPIMLEDSIYL